MNKVRTPNYVCEPCNRTSLSVEICPCTQLHCQAEKKGLISAAPSIIQTMRRKRAVLASTVNKTGLTTWYLAGEEKVWFDNMRNSPTKGKILTRAPNNPDAKILDITLNRVDKL